MKNAFILSMCLLMTGSVRPQAFKGQIEFSKIPVPTAHYQEEYTFDTTLNSGAWNKESKGIHVSFASTDELYFRSEVPQLKNETALWKGTGWKGERLNAAVLVWSPETLQQVRFILSDLKNDKGKLLSKSNVQMNMVRYVASNYPYGAKDVTCGASPYKNLYLMPDRFEAFDRFDVPGKSVRPVWLSVNIPATTEADVYNGTIEVKAINYSTELHLKVVVQNQLLPKPSEWKHRLDLWQNPWVVA